MDYISGMDFVRVPLGDVRTATYDDRHISVRRIDGDYLMSVEVNEDNEICQWMVNTNIGGGFEIFRIFGSRRGWFESLFSYYCDHRNLALGTYTFKKESTMDKIMDDVIYFLKVQTF